MIGNTAHKFVPLEIEWSHGEVPSWLGPLDVSVTDVATMCRLPQTGLLDSILKCVVLKFKNQRKEREAVASVKRWRNRRPDPVFNSVAMRNRVPEALAASQMTGEAETKDESDAAVVTPCTGDVPEVHILASSTGDASDAVAVQLTVGSHTRWSTCKKTCRAANSTPNSGENTYISITSLPIVNSMSYQASNPWRIVLRAEPEVRCFTHRMVLNLGIVDRQIPSLRGKFVFCLCGVIFETVILLWQPEGIWHKLDFGKCVNSSERHRVGHPLMYFVLFANKVVVCVMFLHMYNREMLIECLKSCDAMYFLLNLSVYCTSWCHSELVLADEAGSRTIWFTIGVVLHCIAIGLGGALLICSEAMLLRNWQKAAVTLVTLIALTYIFVRIRLLGQDPCIQVCYWYDCMHIRQVWLTVLGHWAATLFKLLLGYISGNEFIWIRPYYRFDAAFARPSRLMGSSTMSKANETE